MTRPWNSMCSSRPIGGGNLTRYGVGRSIMTTPPDPTANAEITDDSPTRRRGRAGERATPATSRIPASSWAGTRSGCSATAPRPSPPGWRPSRRRATRISLEMYIFSDDAHRPAVRGRADRAPPGAASRCGCSTTSSAAATRPPSSSSACAPHGVHVIAYHRYRFWRPRFWALLRRNHRKTLVCDGRIAFAGGLNISERMGLGWPTAAATGTTPSSRSRARRSPPSRRSSCAPGTGARKKWARLDPGAAAAAGRRPATTRAGRDLEQRAARSLRDPARGAARDPREPRGACSSPTRTSSPIAACCARCSGPPRAASTSACCCRCESDSARPRPGGARRVRAAAGGGRAHLAEPRRSSTPRCCGRRRVRVDRQLQLRSPLARLQPRDGGQRRRPPASTPTSSRCWRRTSPPARS